MLPKPVQQPHPPIYQATISPESFAQAAEKGWHMQFATPFTYRTYREVWMDQLEAHCQRYEALCRERGRDPKKAERMMLVPFFVHEDAKTAREIFKPHVEWFYEKVSSNQLAGAPAPVKGYELTMAEGKKTREMGYLAFDKLDQHGALIADSPEGCIKKLGEMKRRFGITEFVLWSSIGGIDPALAEASMRLAKARVIPHV